MQACCFCQTLAYEWLCYIVSSDILLIPFCCIFCQVCLMNSLFSHVHSVGVGTDLSCPIPRNPRNNVAYFHCWYRNSYPISVIFKCLQHLEFGKFQQQLFPSCIAKRYGCFGVFATSFNCFYHTYTETEVFYGCTNR